MKRSRLHLLAGIAPAALLAFVPSFAAAKGADMGSFSTVSTVASTVPANGDVNPYGITLVPVTRGKLVKNDVLVSNFNSGSNLQGTGTTIVQISPNGTQSLFAQINAATLPGACPGGVGLTTALMALRSGWVIVGSLPTTDGTAATAAAGCLIVLNDHGTPVETFSGGLINGPWDATAVDYGSSATLFITNVLDGTVAANGGVVDTGTVVRLNITSPDEEGYASTAQSQTANQSRLPRIVRSTTVGSGFPQRTDPAALVIGPTGVGFSDGTLYVADSLSNRVAAIPSATSRTSSAGTGITISTNGFYNDPLGLTIAPNGDLVTANGNDGNLVETTPAGTQVAHRLVDASGNPPGSGALFGLVIAPRGNGILFVDDASNTLDLLH